MENTFIDVHMFDGLLKGKYKPRRIYGIAEKRELFHELLEKLTDQNAICALRTILLDLENSHGANLHPENDMDVSNVLADILSNDYDDLLDIISEQLADAKNLGLCNAGRCCRMYQIWKSMYS